MSLYFRMIFHTHHTLLTNYMFQLNILFKICLLGQWEIKVSKIKCKVQIHEHISHLKDRQVKYNVIEYMKYIFVQMYFDYYLCHLYINNF